MANLRGRLNEDQRLELEVDGDPNAWVAALRQVDFVRGVQVAGGKLLVQVPLDEDYRGRLSRWIQAHGGAVLGLRLLEVSLEDAFLTITDHNLSLLSEEKW